MDCYFYYEAEKRDFYECKPFTKKVHKRILELIKKDTPPSYLKSGVKNESYLKNAMMHASNKYFLLIDISKFFPSITKAKIKTSLIQHYAQSKDVAEFLANVMTVPQKKIDNKRALVTGSPLSQYASFFVNKPMYDKLQKIANEYGITFSVYVDDLSFSSKKTIPFAFVQRIIGLIRYNGYKIAKNKIYYGKVGKKVNITGVRITKNGSYITLARKKRIQEKREKICELKVAGLDYAKEQKSLKASIQQAILVNPKYKRYLDLVTKKSLV